MATAQQAGKAILLRPIASTTLRAAVLIGFAMLLILGLLPAALVAAGT